MVTPFKPFGAQTYNLGTSIGSTDTSILLSSFLEPVTGTPYTMALLDTQIVFGTIAPKTSQSEFISFTGITQNANGTALLTGVTRGLAKKSPFTSDSAYKLPHSGQTQFIISDAPQVFVEYAAKANDETITGTWTFNTFPITPTNSPATITALGVVKTSVAPASPSSPIAVETTDPRVPVAYAVDSVGTDAYAITPSPAETAYVTGKEYTFQAGTANTGAATLNVSALGAKTIKKNVSADLATGDILINQIVVCKYDGTNMQLVSVMSGVKDATQLTGLVPTASLSVLATTAGTGNGPASSTTQTITHGLGRTPKIIRINSLWTQANNTLGTPTPMSQGVFNSSGNHCIYYAAVNSGAGANPALDNSNCIIMQAPAGTGGSGLINNVGATTFDIVWTVSGGSVVAGVYIWEAE